MPRHTTLDAPKQTWVEITESDVSNISFANVDVNDVMFVQGTVGSTSPAGANSLNGAMPFLPFQGLLNHPLLELFPGLTGANRVWVYFPGGPGRVSVSHA